VDRIGSVDVDGMGFCGVLFPSLGWLTYVVW
jgi:hypothetical protein